MKRTTILLLVLALASACGVPIDDAPRALDIEVETDIVDVVGAQGDLPAIAEVFLVNDDHLVSVTRQVGDSDAATVVAELLRGPLSAESRLDLRSAIPPETQLLDVSIADGIATADLSSGFTLVGGDEEILAVAQIVATLTSLDGIDGVRLAIEGTLRPAPVAEGELVDRPLRPDDFAELFTT